MNMISEAKNLSLKKAKYVDDNSEILALVGKEKKQRSGKRLDRDER